MTVRFQLSRDEYSAVRRAAKLSGCPLSEFVHRAIEAEVAKFAPKSAIVEDADDTSEEK